jgi:hypothetical protein
MMYYRRMHRWVVFELLFLLKFCDWQQVYSSFMTNIIHSFITNIIQLWGLTLWGLQLLFCSSFPPLCLFWFFLPRRRKGDSKETCLSPWHGRTVFTVHHLWYWITTFVVQDLYWWIFEVDESGGQLCLPVSNALSVLYQSQNLQEHVSLHFLAWLGKLVSTKLRYVLRLRLLLDSLLVLLLDILRPWTVAAA